MWAKRDSIVSSLEGVDEEFAGLVPLAGAFLLPAVARLVISVMLQSTPYSLQFEQVGLAKSHLIFLDTQRSQALRLRA